jgi:hypothetical protein
LHEKLDHIRVEHLEQIARMQQEQLQRLSELCEYQGSPALRSRALSLLRGSLLCQTPDKLALRD